MAVDKAYGIQSLPSEGIPRIRGKNLNEKITGSGLKYENLAEGEGDAVAEGQAVWWHNTVWLTDGTKFDSSLDRNDLFHFRPGAGKVIRG